MAEQSLDALLITHPSNRFYLTGFTAGDIAPNESGGHLLVTADDALLITGSVNVTQAEAQSPHIRVIKREGGWSSADAKAIRELGVRRIGYEPQAMLEGVFRGVGESLIEEQYPAEWVRADGLVEEQRARKSPAEI